jgi:hypothetical protein
LVDPVLALDEDELYVEPGGEARVSVTVRNAGDLVEQYRLEVLGEAARWAQVVPRQISVLPGGAEEKTVSVVFRPPPPPVTVAGGVPFGVRCVSLEEPERCAVVEGDLLVGAVVGVQAAMEPVSPAGRWTGRYRVAFENTGSVPVSLHLRATDERKVLRFAVAPEELTVEPGRRTPAYLAVRPRQPMLRGKATAHAFAVTYETAGGDRSGALAGTFEQRPIVSKGVIALGALLVTAAVAAGAFLVLHKPSDSAPPVPIAGPPPPIALTTASRVSDTSVQLLWQRSPYATGYVVQQLLADGSVAGSKDVADRDQSALVWNDLPAGKHCFRVLAVGPGGRSAASEPKCTTLAKPSPSPSASGGGANGGKPSASAGPGGDAAEPVKGAYVIYAPPTAIDDKAAQGTAEAFVARLQQGGVEARLIDSRTSKRLADGPNNAGLWVVLRDGFGDFKAALAECNARRALAPNCYAVPPA